MKTILITGGAGFIGSNFVRYLYEKYPSYKLLILDALTYSGSIHNLPKKGYDSNRLEFWYGNVKNAGLVTALVSRSDLVFHFAAESHVTRSIYDNLLFFETDVIGTQIVANAVTKHKDTVKLFVHISTSEVYGTAQTEKMSEDHPLMPKSPYASAKCGADRLVYSYWETYGIPAVIIRPFNNYGPYQHLEKLIPRFLTNCLEKEALKVHGTGEASRDWLFVEDHCQALECILNIDPCKLRGEVINLGSGYSLNILEISNIVRELMSATDTPVVFTDNRPGQVDRHTCDFSKARSLLGWSPMTKFEDGIKKTIQWYKNNRAWWAPQLWMREIPITTADGKRVLH